MKYVLHIIAELGIGGSEKVARDIGLYTARAGYGSHYIVFGDEVGEYERDLTDHGCKVFHWPSPSASYPKFYRALKALIRENRYEVVHAHTMFNIGWAMLAARECRVPVRAAHAHSALDNGSGLKKLLYEKAMRALILRNATDLIACGDAAGVRLYGEKAYRERGKRILNGIDTERFAYRDEDRARIRRTLGLEDAFVIGHAGHLIEIKNQAYLIRLMPEILKRKPNAKLLLLGEGADRPRLERLIRDLKLTERVIMTGNVRNVPDYLSAMDVFAFPSLYEGMPLSIVEVQANGLPCVLSSGVPKDVFLTDLIRPLPLDDPAPWVEAVCGAVRKDPERYSPELKAKGFDSDSMMKKIIAIYERTDNK